MRLLLAGATGFLGGEVLEQALASSAIDRVTVLTRRSLGRSHAKKPVNKLTRFLGPIAAWIYSRFIPDFQIGVDEVARGLLAVAARGSTHRILDNAAIRAS